MPLPDAIRDLADQILGRLDEARDFYLHTRQAWRLVQQIAHEGRSVGIVDTATGQEVPAPGLEPMAQRYVTVHEKAGAFARHAEGAAIQIDEPYLLNCFALLREVVGVMAEAAIRRSSVPSSS